MLILVSPRYILIGQRKLFPNLLQVHELQRRRLLTQTRRILLINYEFPPIGGGGGNATLHLAREFAKSGHEPFVLTSAWQDLPAAEDANGIKIRRIESLRRHADHSSLFEMLAFMISALLSAPGWARQWKCEVALVFFTVPCGPIGWLLKRLLNVPYCISLQGGDVPGFDPDKLRLHHAVAGPAIRYLWHDAAAVAANSKGLAALAHQFEPHANVQVIPAGADLDGIAAKTEYRETNCTQLLFVGRFVSQKGLDVLFDSLASIDPALNWHMTLVGDGPDRASLTSQASDLGLTRHITFKAWVEKQKLPDIYRKADIFLLPSRDEGMANALLEAMAAGLPVIGTRVAGTSEVMRDGETGILVPPENSANLAAAITALIKDPERRGVYGRAARARVESSFSWTAAAAQWANILEDAIDTVSSR